MLLPLKLLNALLPLSYLMLVYLYGLHFFRRPRWADVHMGRMLKITLILHFAAIWTRVLLLERFPLTNLYEVLTMIAFALTLVYFFVELQSKVKTTGFFILIVATLLQVISSLSIDFDPHLPEILRSRKFVLHTASILLSYSALFITATYSLMYLLLFRQVKHAEFGLFYGRLPSLDELEDMIGRTAIIGFVFLTAAIFIGLTLRKSEFPGMPHFDPKVITAYLVWVIYSLVIFGKHVGKWPGKQLAWLSLIGFLLILFSMFVVNLFLDTFHQFG